MTLPINIVNGDPDHAGLHNATNAQVNTNTSDLGGKQTSNSNLTTISGLTPSNDDVLQRKAGAWANRTIAQLKTDLTLVKADVGLGSVDNTSDASKPISTLTQTALDLKQTLNTALTSISGLTPTNDDLIQRKSGAWTNRTMAQVKTDLVLVKADVGLGNVDNTSDTAKPISTLTQAALDLKQTLDSDLTAIAAISPSNDDLIQRKSGAWVNRSMAQVKTDLAFTRADVPRRVSTLTAASNVYTPNVDTTDLAIISAPAANFTLAAPTGTPVNGQQLQMRITSDATGRTPTWNSVFVSSGIAALPTTALPASKTISLGFTYDTVISKYVLLASDLVGY